MRICCFVYHFTYKYATSFAQFYVHLILPGFCVNGIYVYALYIYIYIHHIEVNVCGFLSPYLFHIAVSLFDIHVSVMSYARSSVSVFFYT